MGNCPNKIIGQSVARSRDQKSHRVKKKIITEKKANEKEGHTQWSGKGISTASKQKRTFSSQSIERRKVETSIGKVFII